MSSCTKFFRFRSLCILIVVLLGFSNGFLVHGMNANDLQSRFNATSTIRSYIGWDDMNVDPIRLMDHTANILSSNISTYDDSFNGSRSVNYFNTSRIIVVDQSGAGDSVTVQGAVDMVPRNNIHRVKIYIRPGIYREKVHVPQSKPYISFIGNETLSSETVITYNDSAGTVDSKTGIQMGTLDSVSVFIESDYFCAYGITFENAYVPREKAEGNQAVALRIAGTKSMFYKVRILGAQDTLLDQQGDHYFLECYIQGTVDFICGQARSLYKNCVIQSRAKNSGAIAAQKRMTADEKTGFSFVNCTIHGTEGNNLLGRAWGNYSTIVFSYCHFDHTINPKGWSDWNDPPRRKTVLFGEYHCSGTGANRSRRQPWSKSLTDEEASPFLDTKFIDEEEKWLRLS